ncbi:MAG: nucleoside phosphorylase [Bacteroidetes bacterium]|nr:nucleoside phosphorylase [Bacteroidota bacterium]
MARIDESELILTQGGQVYHLNLRPEELGSTVITVGDQDRVKEVSKYFDKIEFTTQHREFVTHTGYVGKKRISVVSSGIGPDNIDIVMNELDACVNIDFNTREIKSEHQTLSIFRFGTSGSLQSEIPVGSLVASTHGIGLDNLLHYYQWENTIEEKGINDAFMQHANVSDGNIKPYTFQGAEILLNHFSKNYHQGITVTCPGFYAPQGRIVRAELKFPELVNKLSAFNLQQHRITNFEMETSAIYGLGKVLGHQCLSINTIVANRIQKTFSTNIAKDVENMIQRNLEIIENI